MGNSNEVPRDPEIRALVHQVNSHLSSKSALLYQISQLKSNLNSRKTYAEDIEEVTNIEAEKEEIPKLLQNLGRLRGSSPNQTKSRIDSSSIANYSYLVKNKIREIEELTVVRDREINSLKNIKEKSELIEKSYNQHLQRIQDIQNPELCSELKNMYHELLEETEKLKIVVDELQNKIKFLGKKKDDILSFRSNRRKTVLGLTIMNAEAVQLRSKYILKNEIIKTIKQTTIEQDIRRSNIESNRLKTEIEVDDKQEEAQLIDEINNYKDKILQLEWEIQALSQDPEKYKRRLKSPEFSINLGSAEKLASEDISENSFGSSIASLISGIGDSQLKKDEIIEENQKLKQQISELFNVRKINRSSVPAFVKKLE